MKNKIKYKHFKQKNIISWEQIPKAQFKNLPRKPAITRILQNAPQEYRASIPLTVLENIYHKNKSRLANNEPLLPHDDLMNIVSHPDLLRLGFQALSRNKGAMTPGPDNNTADDASEQQILQLSESLKKGTFKWSPVRRIMIPKPGKKEKRPLGLPDFNTKMVQFACKEVLQAIYEPQFEKYEVNSGFRPNRDCLHAIRNIKQKAQFADYVIEGDIVGAYNNTDHNILLQILKKRISDKKFLKLLYTGFRAGIVEDYVFYDSLLGVPQGGITSPILFNIYMHEFDVYIEEVLKSEIDKMNDDSPVVEITSQYATLKSKIGRDKTKLKTLQENLETKKPSKKLTIQFPDKFEIIKQHPDKFQNVNFVKNNEFSEIEKIIEKHKNRDQKSSGSEFSKWRSQLLRKLTPEQNSFIEEQYKGLLQNRISSLIAVKRETPYLDPNRKAARIYYHRYADDWTLWVRGNKQLTESLKVKLTNFLRDQLKLELSQEKTRITNLDTDKAKFLGFDIYFPKNELLRKRANNQGTLRVRAIQVAPDQSRLESRFKQRKYMDEKTDKPREVGWLTVLTDYEIITKYNQFMIGLGNYYMPEINQPSMLNKWQYLLYYSCIKTLATKHKISVRNIIRKYGYRDTSLPYSSKTATDLRICAKLQHQRGDKWAILLNYKEFMFRLEHRKSAYKQAIKQGELLLTPQIDFFKMHKANFRTRIKNSTCCTICGENQNLQNHHIKPIKHSRGKFTGYGKFDRLVASLGRKQITVCKQCHHSIHSGQYNGMSLQDLYDARLAAPESYINLNKVTKPNNPSPEKNKIPKGLNPYGSQVDEVQKTYFNPAYRNYLTQQYEQNPTRYQSK